jgi:hypothetical protein
MTGADTAGRIAGWITINLTLLLVALVIWMSRD